jgi:hypothetical protein
VLLSLIILGSSVAFNNIVNLSVAGLYSSYFLTCSLLLWRRLQPKVIKPYSSRARKVAAGNLYWGPWRVPGLLGVINNCFACMYLFVLWFWSFWPPATPVEPETMNISILTFGATALGAIYWYFFYRAKEYKGPLIEVEL